MLRATLHLLYTQRSVYIVEDMNKFHEEMHRKFLEFHEEIELLSETTYRRVGRTRERTNRAPNPPSFLTLLPNPLQSDTEPLPINSNLIQINTRQPLVNLSNPPSTNIGMSGWSDQPTHNETTHTEVRPNANAPQLHTNQIETPIVSHISQKIAPSIDSSHVERIIINNSKTEEDSGSNASSSTCVICLDKPVECVCIPCGHMAGCMFCLKEIKLRGGKCPICRAKIDQVVRFYAV